MKEDKCCFFMIAKSLAGVNKNNLYKTHKYMASVLSLLAQVTLIFYTKIAYSHHQ